MCLLWHIVDLCVCCGILFLLLFYLSYIKTMMKDGFKTYEVLLRHLLRNAANQWPYAVGGFLVCIIGGFLIFLGIQSVHFIQRKQVVSEAKIDGLNGKEVYIVFIYHSLVFACLYIITFFRICFISFVV